MMRAQINACVTSSPPKPTNCASASLLASTTPRYDSFWSVKSGRLASVSSSVIQAMRACSVTSNTSSLPRAETSVDITCFPASSCREKGLAHKLTKQTMWKGTHLQCIRGASNSINRDGNRGWRFLCGNRGLLKMNKQGTKSLQSTCKRVHSLLVDPNGLQARMRLRCSTHAVNFQAINTHESYTNDIYRQLVEGALPGSEHVPKVGQPSQLEAVHLLKYFAGHAVGKRRRVHGFVHHLVPKVKRFRR